MAPEYPPVVVILDSRFEDETLLGNLNYVENPNGRLLRVRWHVQGPVADFAPIGDGVAYVYRKDENNIIEIAASSDATPTPLGNGRYQWTEGLQHDALMFILILPPGYTAVAPHPKPMGTKLFNERIAIYWIANRAEGNFHAGFEWTLQSSADSIEAELVALNQRYLTLYREETAVEHTRAQIRQILTERLDDTDIRMLCFDENLDYENLSGQNKREKIITLLLHFERRNQLDYFLRAVKSMRPDLPF